MSSDAQYSKPGVGPRWVFCQGLRCLIFAPARERSSLYFEKAPAR